MATCYKCGAPNATYRRTTNTGSSVGSWWSSRSYGSSSRTYYGVRSVCQDCAKSIDNWNRIKLIFWIAVILTIGFYFLGRNGNNSSRESSSYQYAGQTARVVSSKGLNLRSQPSSRAVVLLTVPSSEIVGIVDKNGKSETISGQTANWYKVNYRGTEGWLWSGYLKMQ